MSKADHIFNLEEKGLFIDIKDESKGCSTKLESSGKITTNATESIESSADKQIVENVKDSKISISEKEIILATKKSSIMLSDDKIVLKIGNSAIVLDDSSIPIESNTINVKSSANTNIQASQNIGIKSLNTSIKADVSLNAERCKCKYKRKYHSKYKRLCSYYVRIVMNNIDKSFETLVMNIFIYYKQEYQSITSKLDNCLKITIEFIYKPISKKSDVYDLTFITEEIKCSTNYILSDKTIYLSEKILVILENISNSKNYEEIKIHLKSLITLIEKYKLTLGQDFSEKIEDIKIKNIAELTVKLFDKLTEEDIFIINKDELVQIYSKTINNPNQVVIDQYTVFLIVLTHS